MAERSSIHAERPAQYQPSQLAYPLLVDDAAVAVGLWLARSLPAPGAEQGDSTSTKEQLSRLLELTATTLEHERFRAAAMAIVTELAIQVGCDRVGLGFRNGRHTKIYALSHSAQFGEQTNLVRAITAAMDEALDQLDTVIYPVEDDDR